MDKELLNEFLIRSYGNCYVVMATDRAYELLGLKEKEEVIPGGRKRDTIFDNYYIIALVNFLSNCFRIDGLLRESNGNSHDASFETEVIVFNKGGMWCDELNSYRIKKGTTYENKPEVIDKEQITNEIIKQWARPYDLSFNGEGKRLIFCSYKNNSVGFCFSVETSYFVGTAASNDYEKITNSYVTRQLYLEERKTITASQT